MSFTVLVIDHLFLMFQQMSDSEEGSIFSDAESQHSSAGSDVRNYMEEVFTPFDDCLQSVAYLGGTLRGRQKI